MNNSGCNEVSDKAWLKYNIEPYSEVIEKWETTFAARHSFLSNAEDLSSILEEWPLYKQSFGYSLVILFLFLAYFYIYIFCFCFRLNSTFKISTQNEVICYLRSGLIFVKQYHFCLIHTLRIQIVYLLGSDLRREYSQAVIIFIFVLSINILK